MLPLYYVFPYIIDLGMIYDSDRYNVKDFNKPIPAQYSSQYIVSWTHAVYFTLYYTILHE